ncbi:MAG: metal-dependent hydrolase, partial [Flammeovirgaceae bacterium]
MDILIHTLSGAAAATGVAGLFGNSKKERMQLIGIGAFAGALPDFDAISLWSKFDATVGKWLSLSHSGKEIYFGKLWYSHHAFLHSILGALIVLICYWSIRALIRKNSPNLRAFLLPSTTFLLAFCAHLLGDLPTPASVWGGIALWFPSSEYVGGWGKVWWWNNYDIFLILLWCTTINFIVFLLFNTQWVKLFSCVLVLSAFLLITHQVNTRGFDFA